MIQHGQRPQGARRIQVLRTSRRANGASVLGSWLLGSLVLVGWLLVGCRLLVGCLLVGCRLLVGWWLVFGWSVGWWLVVVLVGLLLVLCGWWSASGYKVAPNYLVPHLRTWKGGGWELVVACCGFVGGLLAPWLGGWVENLVCPLVFLGC